MAAERQFRAMGSDAHLIVVGGGAGLIDDAKDRVDDLERRWSRFLDDSEVSELNRQAGRFVKVSPETQILIARAIESWRLTGGAFDPTVLGAVIRSGYDRSFELLEPASGAAMATGKPPRGSCGPSLLGPGTDDITIDGDRVRLAAGSGFDPGGIGKGLAADLVSAEIMAAGAEGVCVNLGGDVRVAGVGPDGAGWTVAVEHPWSAEPIAMLGLAGGAVATSTTLRRRWRVGGETRHHLIDPRTGSPSDSDLALATVVAADAWVAEVLAKAVLLAGSTHPFDIIGGTGAEALAVDAAGRTYDSSGLAAYLSGRVPAAAA